MQFAGWSGGAPPISQPKAFTRPKGFKKKTVKGKPKCVRKHKPAPKGKHH